MGLSTIGQQKKVRQLGYTITKTTARTVHVTKMKPTGVDVYDIEKIEEYLNADFVLRELDLFTFAWRV